MQSVKYGYPPFFRDAAGLGFLAMSPRLRSLGGILAFDLHCFLLFQDLTFLP